MIIYAVVFNIFCKVLTYIYTKIVNLFAIYLLYVTKESDAINYFGNECLVLYLDNI